MAIKVVWAYAGLVLLGGFAMLLYAKVKDESGWPGFTMWALGMSLAVAFGIYRGKRKRRTLEGAKDQHPGTSAPW